MTAGEVVEQVAAAPAYERRVSTLGRLGTPGRLGIFAWSLAMVMLAPPQRVWLAAVPVLALSLLLYPAAFRRLLSPRWLALLGGIVALNALWAGLGSGAGWLDGLGMALRAAVVLMAVDGLSAAVDIGEVAGLLERAGLRGLGFSLGVAFNLLPGLRQSSANAWHSLWMRGGLRRQRRRGLRFLVVTILANALRRAEETALAAEARAFTPERARALPLKRGRWDAAVLLALLVVGVGMAVVIAKL